MTLFGGHRGSRLPAQHHDIIGATSGRIVLSHAERLALSVAALTGMTAAVASQRDRDEQVLNARLSA